MSTSTIALADAKAQLSSVIRKVKETDAQFIVTVRGVPAAMIVPVPKTPPTQPRAQGILSGKRNVASRTEEKTAYREALEKKYANPA